MKAESSTIKTRNFVLAGGAIGPLRHRNNRVRRLRSYEFFDRSEQLIFLDGLGQKSGGAFFDGPVAMFGAGARRDDHDRNAARRGALTQLHHKLIAGHARHFEVSDNQVAAVLGDEFGGFQAVGGQLHAITVLLEHAADKFAHADGVVGNDDDALVLDAIDGFGGNGAASDRGRARSEDARGRRGRLQGAAFAGFGGHHAIQVDQENQPAVGRDGCAGEELDATQILAEVLDDDFVLAEDFLDNQADLAIAGVGHNHAEIAVDGFERRQAEIGVQTDNFGDHVANLSQQLAAHVFDLVGAEPANFLDHGERKREAGAAAAHEQRGGDDQGQWNFQRELGSLAARALDVDFAVQHIEIGAHNVQADAAAGELGLCGRGGKAGVKEHLAEIAVGQAVRGLRRDEAALDGAQLHAIVIDAAAVVFDFNVNVIATMVRAEGNFAGFGLSGGAADVGVFDSVSNGVAHQVHEGIGNLLDDAVVQLGFTAGEIEFDLFGGGGCGVADCA